MIISVISIALSGLFAKLSMQHVSIYFATFIRFFIPLILISIISISFKRYKKFNFKNMKYHLMRSVALTASQFFLFFSMLGLPMSELTVLYNTGPIFIVFFSFFLGEKIKLINLLSLFLGTAGVLLICHIQNGVCNRYVIYGLISGIGFCISQMTLHNTSKKEDNTTTMFFLYAFTSLFSLIIFLIFSHKSYSHHTVSFITYLFLLMLGLSSLSNQFFRGKAYKESNNPVNLAPLLYLSVFISAFLDFFFFHIHPDNEVIIGGLCILLGSCMSSMKQLPIFINFKLMREHNV